jgi:hypothetical protein
VLAMPTVREVFVKIQKERCRELIKTYIHTEVDNDIREQVRDEVQKNNAGLMDGSVAAVPSAVLPAS